MSDQELAIEELEAKDPRELDFLQLVQGVHACYRDFQRAQQGQQLLADVLSDKREAPVFTTATGRVDEEGKPIQLVLDCELLLRRLNISDPEKRRQLLQQILGPYYNYFVLEYRQAAKRLADFSNKLHKRLSQTQ